MLPIITISLPTPWASVGPIHAYLLRTDPLTLIDTGLNTPESRAALEGGLKQAGVSVTDIKRVLLTHAHFDHAGQAAWIQAESGAPIHMHPDEEGKAFMPPWWHDGRLRALDEAGMPQAVVQQVDRVWRISRSLALPMGAWEPLANGQRIPFDGGELEVVHLPGHALGHVGFFHGASGTLVGGDHLLDGITPNPIMEPLPSGHPAGAPHAPWRALTLGQFLGALERVALMPVNLVLPGHGEMITDHAAIAQRYIEKHERRLDKMDAKLIAGSTVYALTKEIYPWVKDWDIFLALSEVMAHLDLLVARGRATYEPAAGGYLYRATTVV